MAPKVVPADILTDAQVVTAIGGLQESDRVTVVWAVRGTAQRDTWHGQVRHKNAGGTAITVRYDGQGDDVYDLPHVDADIYSITKVGDARPSMRRAAELGRNETFSETDLSTWTTLMADRVGISLLMGRIRERFVPRVSDANDQVSRDQKRSLNYYELEYLVWVLEGWCLSCVGTTTFNSAPQNNVPLRILHRLFAYELSRKQQGSVHKYMEVLRSRTDPKEFQECRKAALAKGGVSGGE